MVRKSLLVLIVVLVALGVVLAGCQQGAASPTPAPTAKPAGTTPPAAGADGKAIFDKNCNGCHPNGQQGAGPSLVASRKSVDEIKTQVRQGKGAMPAFPATTISDADLNTLANYVKGLQK